MLLFSHYIYYINSLFYLLYLLKLSLSLSSFLTLVLSFCNLTLTTLILTGIVSNVFSIYIFLRCERGGTPAIQYYLVSCFELIEIINELMDKWMNEWMNDICFNQLMNEGMHESTFSGVFSERVGEFEMVLEKYLYVWKHLTSSIV